MYYLGFLKYSPKHVVVFKSLKTPKPGDFRYFVHVMGPYNTEARAREDINTIKLYGYRENSMSCCKNPASSDRQRRFMCSELGRLRSGKKTVTRMKERQLRDFCRKRNPKQYMSDRQALALTKKVIAYGKRLLMHEKSELRRNNPIEGKQVEKFIKAIRKAEKYVVGSYPYVVAIAQAYEYLEKIKEEQKRKSAV